MQRTFCLYLFRREIWLLAECNCIPLFHILPCIREGCIVSFFELLGIHNANSSRARNVRAPKRKKNNIAFSIHQFYVDAGVDWTIQKILFIKGHN